MDENGNSFPPLPPSALTTLFEMPEFTELPYEKRREKLSHALSAVYDYSVSQPDFKDENSADFNELAGRAYDKLDKGHTLGEKAVEVAKGAGQMLVGLAKDIVATGVAAVSASAQSMGIPDPTKAAQTWGYGFGLGSARYLDAAAHTLDKWTSQEDNDLRDSLGEVKKQIDEGAAPITDPAKFTSWVREQSAKVLVPQNAWTVQRLNDYGDVDPVGAFTIAEKNQLSNKLNTGLLQGYVRTRDPKVWEQLEKNIVTTPLAGALGEEAQKVVEGESGMVFNRIFGDGASEHLLSSSDPLMVASYLLPAARASLLGKAVAGGAGKAAVATSLGAGAAEQGSIGAASTIGHDPEASATEVGKGAVAMVALGTAIHGAGAGVGALWKRFRSTSSRLDAIEQAALEGAPDVGTAAGVRNIVELARKKEQSVPVEEPTPPAPTDQRTSATGVTEDLPAPVSIETPLKSVSENATTRSTPDEPPAAQPTAEGVPVQAAAEQAVERSKAGLQDSQQDLQPTGGDVAAQRVDISNLRKLASSPRLGEAALRLELKEYTPQERASVAEQLGTKDGSPAALAKSLKFGTDWIKATEEAPPSPRSAERVTSEVPQESSPNYMGLPLPKFKIRKVNPLDEATGLRSSKLQRSNQETAKAQSDLRKAVPSKARRKAISFWREADGDAATLQAWEAGAKSKWMKDGARIAQTLTPEEIHVARTVADTFNTMEKRGNTYDVLKGHKDNYIPHVWDLPNPAKGFGTRSLKKKFAFAKARTLNTFFDGDQIGMKPRTLDVADLVPGYIAEMNRVIADRQFVADILDKPASDGAPLAIPRGSVTTTTGKDVAHLVHPQGQNMVKDAAGEIVDQSKYKVLQDQPALRTWRWRGKDTESNPIMLEGDLALHPEAYRRIHAMMGESGVRKWYRETEGSAQVPKAFVRSFDVTQAAMKREMFGLLAPFHQVQEGTHAVGHLVNPFFGLKGFDLSSPAGADAAKYVMLLPDKTSGRQYFEGVGGHKSLISTVSRKFGGPAGKVVADTIEGYQKYLFESYIPRLKYATYQKILERNTKRFAPEMKAGEVTVEDVKLLSGTQTDAAYGHLNYTMLDRDPTFQHFLQLGLLAPDFLEARARFVGQATKAVTSKVGKEQLKAIAVLAAAQAGAAFTLAQVTGGKWEAKHPFEFTYGSRRYTMRSVPEDAIRALAFVGGGKTNWDVSREFTMARINPLLQTGVQLGTGLNYRGEKVGPIDTLTEAVAKFIPLTARSMPGIRELTATSRNAPTSPLEQFAGSVGIKITRASPITDAYKLAHTWMKSEKIETSSASYPVSKYQKLRYALEDSDSERAQEEYLELRKTMSRPKIVQGFHESITHPFTKSQAMDRKFKASLTGEDREVFDLAQQKRQDILNRFRQMKK